MKKYFVFVLLICFVFTAGAAADSGKKLGKALTLKKVTLVSDILEKPQEYVGKTVLVEGTIVEVCEMKGCWMEIAADKPFMKIRGKVQDGVIVFPMEDKGKKAMMEGEFVEIKLSKEQAIAQAKHEAEMHGTEFDPAKVGPRSYFQINVIGAVIK